MFWFTGACTLTGPSTNTEMRMNTQNTPSVVSVSRLFSHSYDSWLSSSDVEGEIEEPPHSEKPWRVGSVAHMQKTPKQHLLLQRSLDTCLHYRLYFDSHS